MARDHFTNLALLSTEKYIAAVDYEKILDSFAKSN